MLQISIYQAVADRIISQHQGLYRNPLTGEGMPIPEAMNKGLIIVERTNRIVEMGELIKSGIIRTSTKRETVTYSVLSIRDPSSSEKISVAEALRRGIVNQDAGRYVTNLRSGESISIPAAIDRGFLEVEVIDKKALEPISPPADFTDRPSMPCQLSSQSSAVTGAETVELPSDTIDSNALSSDTLIQLNWDELLETSTRKDVDVGQNAYEQLTDTVDVHYNGIVDPSSGQTVSIDEARRSGLLVLDPLGIMLTDGNCITVEEAAASGLIDVKLLRDLLTGFEQMSLDNMAKNGIIDIDSGQFRDPDTECMLPMVNAISDGKLDPHRVFYTDLSINSIVSLGKAIENGVYEPASNTFIDTRTEKKANLADAVSEGLVLPAINADERTIRAAVLKTLGKYVDLSMKCIKDPWTREDISLPDAVAAGIVDISSGMYVDPRTGKKLSLSEAVGTGLVSLEMAKQLLAAMDDNSLAKSNIDLRSGEYVDPDTQQQMSIQKAIDERYIEPAAVFLVDPASSQLTTLSALMVNDCRFDPAAGAFANVHTGQTMSLADALSSGLMNPCVDAQQLSKNLTVLKALGNEMDTSLSGIRDSRTGNSMTLSQAIMLGVIDLSSGELVNQQTGETLAITDAIAAKQISLEMGKQLLSAMNRNSLANSNIDLATGQYVDPLTEESMSVESAISCGLIEPAAVFMVDPVSAQLTSLATLIDDGSFNPTSGNIRNSTTGVEISVAAAEQNGIAVADFSVDGFLPAQTISVKDLVARTRHDADDKLELVTVGGQTMDLQDAIRVGLVTEDMTVEVDDKTGMVSVVDESQRELVDASAATRSIMDWLDDVEQTLSSNSRIRLDDAASVQQEIASLQV